jgi:hypothetical protein
MYSMMCSNSDDQIMATRFFYLAGNHFVNLIKKTKSCTIIILML